MSWIRRAWDWLMCNEPPAKVRQRAEVVRLQTLRNRALRNGDFEKAERLAKELAER